MRKFLALVLALVMTMSLVTVGANAFTDDSQISDKEAVEVLSAMGILKGYDDGSYRPQNTLTRGAGAKIIAYLLLGQTVADQLEATYTKFDDVTDSVGLAPYIEWAAANGIVDGYGNGKFGPYNPLTEYAFGKMLLTALGYSSAEEGFTGAGWQQRVLSVAVSAGVFDGSESPSRACTRETAASFALNALKANVVVYGSGEVDGSYYWNGIKVVGSGAKVEGVYKTDKALWQFYKGLSYNPDYADKWGRPGHSWTYNKNELVYLDAKVGEHTVATSECEIATDLGLSSKSIDVTAYDNGVKVETKIDATKTAKTLGGQGVLLEVYKHGTQNVVVRIDTYLAYVYSNTDAVKDAAGHVVKDAYSTLYVYGYDKTDAYKAYDGCVWGYLAGTENAAGSWILVNYCAGETYYDVVADAGYAIAQLTKVVGASRSVGDIQNVLGIDSKDVTVNANADLEPTYREDKDGNPVEYDMYLGFTYYFFNDQYGNVIGALNLGNQYAVLDSLYRVTDKGTSTANGNVVFFDGSIDKDAAIARVDNRGPAEIFELKELNRGAYYNVYSYVEENGAYLLVDADFDEADYAEYYAGEPCITLEGNHDRSEALQLSNSTQILLQTTFSPDGTFKAFVGYKDLPSFAADYVQYLDEDGDGYVDYVYATGVELNARTVFVYDVTPISSEITQYPEVSLATVKALELKDGKLVETTFTVLYEDTASSGTDAITPYHVIDRVGLYEIVESEYGYYFAIDEEELFSVEAITSDGLRVTIDGEFEDLTGAVIARYTGSWTKGTVESPVAATSLGVESYVFLQRDAAGKVVAVYDMCIPVSVTCTCADTTHTHTCTVTGGSEYFGKSFRHIKVELAEYEEIDQVKMDGSAIRATVVYVDVEGNKVATLDPMGTKVAYAVISYPGNLVWGDIAITVKNQAAYTVATLKDTGVVDFPTISQQFMVENGSATTILGYKVVGTIKINKAAGDVHVADLKAALELVAKNTNYQVILKVVNTYNTTLANGDVIPEDAFLVVQAWDGSTVVAYSISVGTTNLAA
ncbi:MAG: S-layer homology domain-containing protein [Oscillospiraceae bacterium]